MENREYIDLFISYSEKVRSLSENTILAYEEDLNAFLEYVNKVNLSFEDFSVEDSKEYVRFLKKNFAESSVLRKITALHSFFSY